MENTDCKITYFSVRPLGIEGVLAFHTFSDTELFRRPVIFVPVAERLPVKLLLHVLTTQVLVFQRGGVLTSITTKRLQKMVIRRQRRNT